MFTLCTSRRCPQSVAIALILIFILTACISPQSTAEPIVIETFDDAKAIFKEIREAEPEASQDRADQLWQTLADSQRVPLILDTQVIFLYKGESEKASWSGSFNRWSDAGFEGVQLGKTDLWIACAEFPEASRVEYKIILNGDEWINDPANPNTAFSGLTGANDFIDDRMGALPTILPNQGQRHGSIRMKPTFDALSACDGETGVECLPINLFVTAGWPDWDVGNFDMAVVDLQHKGYAVEFHHAREGHTWDHWRGFSDEMLLYFFGSD